MKRRISFPPYIYHYRPGGHVAALHEHIQNHLFFKIDIQNFFYSIAKERVARALRKTKLLSSGHLAKWSCVRNPYLGGARYVLPIGFVQSPIVATLVLLQSDIARAIERAITSGVTISVYLDDFVGSHNDRPTLQAAYEDVCAAIVAARFVANVEKLTPPENAIVAFNCDLTHGETDITEKRMQKFLAGDPTGASIAAFDQYRQRVTSRNI
ncbi:MAG: hypothetical protein KF835_10685 [Xanthobacteraceae bacterium]|nr:hypothetical protein [Xanthobacteraceae bacterium]